MGKLKPPYGYYKSTIISSIKNSFQDESKKRTSCYFQGNLTIWACPTFTFSKLTTEALEKEVKYVQN